MAYERLNLKDGQVLTADHVKHLEDGIEAAGGVSSWNDLADKPFGENLEEVLASTEATFVYDLIPESGVYGALVQTDEATYNAWLAAPGPVQVTWDETVWSCDFQDIGGMRVVGNAASTGGAGNGEPFGLTMMAEPTGDITEYFWVFLSVIDPPPSDTANAPTLTHTVGVSLGEIKLLDAKYLPMDAIRAVVNEVISEALEGEY